MKRALVNRPSFNYVEKLEVLNDLFKTTIRATDSIFSIEAPGNVLTDKRLVQRWTVRFEKSP